MEFEGFCENFPIPEREAMVVASETLVVYAPFAQWLNVECSSSFYSQMQSGWLLLMDGYCSCRTDGFRRYLVDSVFVLCRR